MPFTFKGTQKAVAAFFLIGVFLLLAIFILIAKGSDLLTFKDSYFTVLEEGYGLNTGMSIKYKGINVGKIRSMRLAASEDKIKVEVWIFSDYRNLIRQDSVLKVQSSLLGASSLVLLPTLDTNSKLLLPGSEIYSSDVDKGQEIMARIAEASPQKADLTGKVNQILDYIAELKPAISSTLFNVRDSTASLKSILGGLKGSDRSVASDKLLATLDNVKTMSKNFKELSEELNSTNNSIGAIVKDKKAMQKKIDRMLASVDGSLNNVKTITDKFQDSPDDIKGVILLLKENLVESKKVLIGMKNFLGGEKETEKTIKAGHRR